MIRPCDLVTGVAFTLACVSGAAYAQEAQRRSADAYPARPIRVLLGVAPSGGLDSVTRLVAQKLGERLGQAVIVDNRPGATSTIAMNLTANASPDGYTVMGATKTMILNGAMKKVPYDILKTFVPVAPMSTQVYVMVVNPALPVRSIGELITYAKARPGMLNYASSGVGSLQHLGMELFKSMTGTAMEHVAYKGGGPALIDTISGQIQVMPTAMIGVAPHLRSGKLRAIAVTGAQRIQALPELPTIAESGVAGFDITNIYGLYAPSGTAPALVSTLNRAVADVIVMPDLARSFSADGVEPAIPTTPEQFRQIVVTELDRWTKFLSQSRLRF